MTRTLALALLAFDQANQTMDAKRWVTANKQMHMVWHDLQFDHVGLTFESNLPNNRLQAVVNAAYEQFPAIFWAPDDVIGTGIDHIQV